MPAASCRIMPARSISRCETISASFGFSLRMGRKNRDNRMGTLEESVRHGKPAVKPDRVQKHKAGDQGMPLSWRNSCCFAGDIEGANKAPARHNPKRVDEKALNRFLRVRGYAESGAAAAGQMT